jgi:hypothetical protein
MKPTQANVTISDAVGTAQIIRPRISHLSSASQIKLMQKTALSPYWNNDPQLYSKGNHFCPLQKFD